MDMLSLFGELGPLWAKLGFWLWQHKLWAGLYKLSNTTLSMPLFHSKLKTIDSHVRLLWRVVMIICEWVITTGCVSGACLPLWSRQRTCAKYINVVHKNWALVYSNSNYNSLFQYYSHLSAQVFTKISKSYYSSVVARGKMDAFCMNCSYNKPFYEEENSTRFVLEPLIVFPDFPTPVHCSLM